MDYEFDHATADVLWQALLDCRELLRDPEADRTPVAFFTRRGDTWAFGLRDESREEGVEHTLVVPLEQGAPVDRDPAPAAMSVFDYHRFRQGLDPLRHLSGPRLEKATATTFRLYLPLLVGAHDARRRGTAFVVAHVAQTLDGRIACLNGHSQWISNQANLVHSHRLRALHDVVLIGSRTVATDDPLLTVRHVEGQDPRRVVLSGSASVFRESSGARLFRDAGALVLCSERTAAGLGPLPDTMRVRVVGVPSTNGSKLDPEDACRALAAEGAGSVFLEGGAVTMSHFLDQGRIDVLHVHVAPMILGSGISSFALPEVARVQEGRKFHMQHFALDGEVLFECRGIAPGEACP